MNNDQVKDTAIQPARRADKNTRRQGVRNWRRLLQSDSWGNRLAFVLVVAAIASGIATYGALNATPPFGNDPNTVIWLLNIDLIIILLLVMMVARRIVSVWSGRRRGVAGAHLHVRLVFIFSIMAAVPAVIMTIFAAFFLHFGVQSWFSERVRTAVNEAEAVAESYLAEHMQVIRADTLAMANDLDRQAGLFINNDDALEKVMQTQSLLRNLSEALIVDSTGRVMARSGFSYALEVESMSSYLLTRANDGEVVLMTADSDDRVRALVKLSNFIDSYLFVGRMVDPTVLSHLADTKKAALEYEELESQRSSLQIKITMIFIVVALLLMCTAIWLGLIFSRKMIIPVSLLISAADRVRGGDLTARVPEFDRQDEFDVLARAFNRMTSQIQEQRNELITANRQLDQRRRFTETVLAGVSSGVVGLDARGHITLVNNSAARLFGREVASLQKADILDIVPELKDLLAQAHQKPGKITQGEIPFVGADNARHTFLVRIAIELIGDEDTGAVLTFDDITELQSAQRKAAWADVARRIAHEIKNPLTPIQLSAERLKRKYMKQIVDGSEIFAQCTDTIIHHVGDIGRMVDEFSAFARMPEPVIKRENLSRIINDVLVLQQQAHPAITFDIDGIDTASPLYAHFDAQQFRQALVNIIQNAIDSIYARQKDGPEGFKGHLRVLLRLSAKGDDIFVSVMDNGLGLPSHVDAARLTEPYVTHKEKGTGLGLAIVKKIMEDHKGRLVLGAPEWLKAEVEGWKDPEGATVTLILPLIIVDAVQDSAAGAPPQKAVG